MDIMRKTSDTEDNRFYGFYGFCRFNGFCRARKH